MKTSASKPRRQRREPIKQLHSFVIALGQTLRLAQRRHAISDTALAASAGVVTATVGNLARGFCDPKASTVWRLCEAMGEDIVKIVRRAKRRHAGNRKTAPGRLTH